MRYLLFFAVIVFVATSCNQIHGSGNIIKEKREIGSFTGVETGGAFEVEIKTGATTEVIVESDDNILPYIKTKVVGGILEISNKGSFSFGNGHFKVFITVPAINLIKASGAASIKGIDELRNTEMLKMEASGAASINAIVNAPDIQIEASGASHIELNGRTRKFTAEASGSADVKCASLQSETADLSASGASTIHAIASVSIVAKASGAATIYHLGTNNITEKVSGAASIKSGE
jgi:hypothetical protein